MEPQTKQARARDPVANASSTVSAPGVRVQRASTTGSRRDGLPIRLGQAFQRATDLYAATPLDRVTIIRQGVPAAEVVEISEGMGVGKERVYSILGLPRATVVRKIKNNEALSPEQSERVIGLERLIGQVATMVVESGDPTGFDAGQWVGEWLECPLAALGGAKPGDFMDTMEGQEIVSKLLAQAQSGAYS